jgi:hypothetical protein
MVLRFAGQLLSAAMICSRTAVAASREKLVAGAPPAPPNREKMSVNSTAFSFAAGAPISDPACLRLRAGSKTGVPRFFRTGSHSSRQS